MTFIPVWQSARKKWRMISSRPKNCQYTIPAHTISLQALLGDSRVSCSGFLSGQIFPNSQNSKGNLKNIREGFWRIPFLLYRSVDVATSPVTYNWLFWRRVNCTCITKNKTHNKKENRKNEHKNTQFKTDVTQANWIQLDKLFHDYMHIRQTTTCTHNK